MGTTATASRRSRSRAFGSLAGNRALLRVLVAYLMFTLTEYAVWIAMLVFAYRRGGTVTTGLVAVAQLVPAAVVAPVVASAADRRSPVALLAGGYLAQAAAMAGTAMAVGAGAPLAAYAGAVVAAAAVTTTRPAQSALIPSVSATPDQLTAANVVVGWMEAAGVAAAGLLAGVLISLAGVGSVFAVCAGLGLLAALLVAGLRVTPLAAEPGTEEPAAGIGSGIRLALRQPRLRLMLALLTADAVVIGALDLLVVILAIAVLGRPPGWAGYLQFAFGAGALLAATVSAVLVGRRLGGPILAATLAFSVALAAVAFGLGLAGTVALLAVAGAGHSLLAVATRTLLQRSVPPQLIGRMFGVLEGLTMAGLALGALLVPALAHLGGNRLAVLGGGGYPAAGGRGRRARRVPPRRRHRRAGRADRAAALAAVVLRTASPGHRRPGGVAAAGAAERRGRADPAG